MYCPKGQTWAYTSARLRLLLCRGEVAERIWQVCPYELPLHELLLSLGHPALLSAKVFSLSWCLHSRLAPCSMSCTLGKINRSGMELLAFPPERSMSTTTLFFDPAIILDLLYEAHTGYCPRAEPLPQPIHVPDHRKALADAAVDLLPREPTPRRVPLGPWWLAATRPDVLCSEGS